MSDEAKPLDGRVALVTGVSRTIGIGHAVAERLGHDGAALFLTGWQAHDDEMPWGAGTQVEHVEADLADPAAPGQLMAAAVERFGHVDILVLDHARSSHQSLQELTAEEIDLCMAVNVRASLLLTKAFAAQHDGRPGGRVVLFTSGQYLGAMPGELPYTASKGALHQLTFSLAQPLMAANITVNTVNPGPNDTGWADPDTHAAVEGRMPRGRWGRPDDVARLIAWLVSDEADWVTGQVIASDGGFR